MKRFKALSNLFLMLSIATQLYAIPKKPEPCGNVVTVSGVVTVKSKQLQAGGPIFAGDEVVTYENSAVKFLMVDKSIIDLGPTTSFKFEDYRDGAEESRQAELSLDYGSVRASVTKKLDNQSKFHIRTKSSVLAVRGTEFLAKWETKDGKVTEQVTVGSGRVEMNTGGKMLALNPGNQYTATGRAETKEQGGNTGTANNNSGSANTESSSKEKPVLQGEVITLAPEKVKETLKEAKVEDKTFADTVTFEKRSTKEVKKKEEKVEAEGDKTAKSDIAPKKEVKEAKDSTETKEDKKETAKTDNKGEAKPENKKDEKNLAKNTTGKPDVKPDTKPAEGFDSANGTLGSVFQGVTGERLDGKPVIIAKGPDSTGMNPGNGPALLAPPKEGDRRPSSDTANGDNEPKTEGPKLPPSYFDPNRPPTATPGTITGNGSTTPAAPNNPSTTTQTVTITVKVPGVN